MVEEKLKGLGGWMIFPIIGLYFYGVIAIFSFIIFLSYPENLSDFSIVITSAIGIGLTYQALSLMHKRSKKFPEFYIWWIWLVYALGMIESIILNDYSYMSFGIISAIIWTFYMKKSKRVKNTFVK